MKGRNGTYLQAVAAVESMSQHPLARAIVDYAQAQGAGKAEVREFPVGHRKRSLRGSGRCRRPRRKCEVGV